MNTILMSSAEWTEPVGTVAPSGPASLAWLLFVVPAVAAALLLLLGKKADGWGHWLVVASSWFSFALGVLILIQMLRAPSSERRFQQTLFEWIPAGSFNVQFGLLIDPLSMTFIMLVTLVGSLIMVYSVGYMEHDPGKRRFFAYMAMFIASMLILVVGDSYTAMFLGWEGVGLCSYLLIGFWNQVPANATAAKKAFVMNRVGDAGFLIAMMAMVAYFSSTDFAVVNAEVGGVGQTGATIIGLFLLLAATGKSAQYPLQAWLGDAMAGPTPVSALIHAATMVTAGVYLVVRSGIIFLAAPIAMTAVAIVGAVTLLLGAIIGTAKDDIKKALAASTMSQVGYMMLGAGLGPIGWTFAIFHLLVHGFFKSLMFLGAGSVMHAMNDQVNMRRFGALKKYMTVTWLTFMAGWLAILGVAPFSGYWSKDRIIEAAFATGNFGTADAPWIGWVFGFVAMFAAGLTSFYMSRVFFMTFSGKARWTNEMEGGPVHPRVEADHDGSYGYPGRLRDQPWWLARVQRHVHQLADPCSWLDTTRRTTVARHLDPDHHLDAGSNRSICCVVDVREEPCVEDGPRWERPHPGGAPRLLPGRVQRDGVHGTQCRRDGGRHRSRQTRHRRRSERDRKADGVARSRRSLDRNWVRAQLRRLHAGGLSASSGHHSGIPALGL